MERARRLVYVEDQYLWGHHVGDVFTEALREHPDLHVIAVVPLFPDLDGALGRTPQLLGRRGRCSEMAEAAPDRVAIYGIENHAGTPVYVHAKVCVIDDTWATIGSDNFNRRSWTHDSELSAVVVDTAEADDSYARRLRLTLAAEHLDRPRRRMADCVEPAGHVRGVRRVGGARSTPGTTAAGSARGRRAGCAGSRRPSWAGSRARSRGARTWSCTTPTAGPRPLRKRDEF